MFDTNMILRYLLNDNQEMDVLNLALDTYAERNLDFVDCVLYGYHAVKDVKIATFDKKLLKLMANY